MLTASSKNIILADGGANHFHETLLKDSPKLKTIVGDLDSIDPEVLSYYKEKGIKI